MLRRPATKFTRKSVALIWPSLIFRQKFMYIFLLPKCRVSQRVTLTQIQSDLMPKEHLMGGYFNCTVCVCVRLSLKYSNVGELKQRITLDFPDLPEEDTFRHFFSPCIANKLEGIDACNKTTL
jgi:hypothetical protein